MDNPDPNNRFWSSRRWLARSSFSFLIIAALLAYSGYRGSQTHRITQGRVAICYIAAAMAFSLFLMGTRERHRRDDEDNRR